MTNGELLKSNSAVIQQLFCFLSGGEVPVSYTHLDYPASSAVISGKSDLYMQENEIFPVLTARFSIYGENPARGCV